MTKIFDEVFRFCPVVRNLTVFHTAKGQLVTPFQIGLHEVNQIESDVDGIPPKAWQALAPSGFRPEAIMHKLRQGAWVYLTANPKAPLFCAQDGVLYRTSQINTPIPMCLQDMLAERFDVRDNAAEHKNKQEEATNAQHEGVTWYRKKSALGGQMVAGELLDAYTPEPVISDSSYTPRSQHHKPLPDIKTLELRYDDQEQTYAAHVPFVAVFADGREVKGKTGANGYGVFRVNDPQDAPKTIRFGWPEEIDALATELTQLYQELNDAVTQIGNELKQRLLSAVQSGHAQGKPPTREQRAAEAKAELKAAIERELTELRQRAADYDHQGFFQQLLDDSAAFVGGVGGGFGDYLPDLGEFGDFLDVADIDIDVLADALITGDIDQLESRFQDWSQRNAEGYAAMREVMEKLILLLNDEEARSILLSLPKRLLAAMPDDEAIEIGVSFATQNLIDGGLTAGGTALGSVVGGVGAPVLGGGMFAATTGRKASKALEATVDVLVKVIQSEKKLRNTHEGKYQYDNRTHLQQGNQKEKVEITNASRKRVKKLIKKLSDNSRQDSGLSQEKVDKLRRIVDKAGGKLRNDGVAGVKGSSAGRPHVQTEGLGKSIDSRHIWTQPGVR